ncbi:MAG: hypothetical protein M1819_007166 [Sarea resinae]|nr:MAG: hypothetical protein M1819_007166 [Sarea resinae]
MISASRRWLRRNRTNFAVGAGLLGLGYVATQYALSKLAEAREAMSRDRIARENLRRRFEQNQEDCTFTVLVLLPTATENILEAYPVEAITRDLQQKKADRLARSTGTSEVTPSELSSGPPSVTDDDGRSLQSFQSESYIHASQVGEGGPEGQTRTKKTRVQLWDDLKISSITRAFTLLYTLSLLTLLTRIQLNLLGRRNYLSSVVSLAASPAHDPTINLENHDDDNFEQAYGNDFETNRRYLTFSWWLLHRGWREIANKVEAAVREVFGTLNPREDISLERMSELTVEVRKRVEGATEEERRAQKWLPYLLPPHEEEDHVLRESGMSSMPASPTFPSPQSPTQAPPPPTSSSTTASSSLLLRRLLDETADLIDSPTFTHLETLILDSLFTHLTDAILLPQAFKVPAQNPLPQPSPSPSPSTTTTSTHPAHEPQPPSSSSSSPPSAQIQELIPAHIRTKLANLLAVLTRQAHVIGHASMPNDYLAAVERDVRDLDAFAAVVYSSNFEFEVPSAESAALDETAGARAEKSEKDVKAERKEEKEELKEVGKGTEEPEESPVDSAGETSNFGFESAWGKATTTTTTAAGSVTEIREDTS